MNVIRANFPNSNQKRERERTFTCNRRSTFISLSCEWKKIVANDRISKKKSLGSIGIYHGWSMFLILRIKKISEQIIPTIKHYCTFWIRDILRFLWPALSHVRIIMVPPSKSELKVKPSTAIAIHRSLHKMKNVFFGPKHSSFDVFSKTFQKKNSKEKKYYIVTFNLFIYVITLTGICNHHGFLFVCGLNDRVIPEGNLHISDGFHRHDWHQVKYVKS